MLSQEHISELTVEDPAEAFEDLRDRNDLKMVLGLKRFMEEGFGTNGSSKGGRVGPIRRTKSSTGAGKMGPPVNKAWAEKWRVQLKIAGVCCGGSGFSVSNPLDTTAPIPSIGGNAAIAQSGSSGCQGLQSV